MNLGTGLSWLTLAMLVLMGVSSAVDVNQTIKNIGNDTAKHIELAGIHNATVEVVVITDTAEYRYFKSVNNRMSLAVFNISADSNRRKEMSSILDQAPTNPIGIQEMVKKLSGV